MNEAKKSVYYEPNLHHIGFERTSIIDVSKKNGLILANGNEWTGYKHIMERHSLSSRKPYWKGAKLDDPTKFRPELAPVEYMIVAESIYKPDNLRNDKNKRIDEFDLYIGIFKHFDGKEVEYKLLVYKNTKVIHTFYVNENKKPFNKQKILDLRQGWSKGSYNVMNCIETSEISYYNQDNTVVCKLIVIFDQITGIESWYVQKNSDNGIPFISTCIRKQAVSSRIIMPFYLDYLDYEDISWAEKIIKQIINNSYKFWDKEDAAFPMSRCNPRT
jgi:hypothetical protein